MDMFSYLSLTYYALIAVFITNNCCFSISDNLEFSSLIQNKSCETEVVESSGEYAYIIRCMKINILDSGKSIPVGVTALIYRESNEKVLNESVLQHLGETLTVLKILSGRLRFLTSDFFKGLPKLIRISLRGNNIYSLPRDLLQHNPNVEEFDISGNVVRSLKTIFHVTVNLPRLLVLKASENKILEEIHDDDFDDVRNSPMEHLYLSDCAISKITSQSFAPLTNLKVLDISINPLNETGFENMTFGLANSRLEILTAGTLFRLRNIPTKALSYLNSTNITEIRMRYGRIISLDEFAFPYLPTLKTLELNDGTIRTIHPKAFSNLPNLEDLILKENELTNTDGLTNLTQLIRLEMAKNKHPGISFHLSEYQLTRLKNLQKLSFRSCTINSAFKKGILKGLISLENLNLDDMTITSIEDGAFEDLGNLTVLHLSANRLQTLEPNVFNGLSNLDQLYLYENIFNFQAHVNPFRDLENLGYIALSNNLITILPKGLFTQMNKLEIVNLSKNKIPYWIYDVFPSNANMKAIYLESNMIQTVSPRMLVEFSNLDYGGLFLEYNPLDCRLSGMFEFQQWLRNTSVVYRKNQLTCKVSDTTFENLVLANITEPHYLPEPDTSPLKIALSSIFAAIIAMIIILTAYKLRWYFRYWIFLMKIKADKNYKSKCKLLYEYDAFVSYSNEDSNWVIETFLPYLEKYSVKLCLHQRDFEVGIPITDNILRAIEVSKRTVIILSRNFINSNWCILEAHMAEHALREERRDGILIVSLEDIKWKDIPKNLRFHDIPFKFLRYIMKTRTHLIWSDSNQGQINFWKQMRSVLDIKIENEIEAEN